MLGLAWKGGREGRLCLPWNAMRWGGEGATWTLESLEGWESRDG